MAKKPESLDKPVHAVVLKPHHLEKLNLKSGGVIKSLPKQQKLPKEEVPQAQRSFNPLAGLKLPRNNVARETSKKTRLRVLYDNLPPIPPDKKPPCDECKTSACCYAFVVAITKEEYESGAYEPYAVKLDPEYMKQLKGRSLLSATVLTPVHGVTDEVEYYLEGEIGQPCPFLGDNGRCTIYEYRPATCRVYTCVGDDRITQEIRDGKAWLFDDRD